MGYAVMADFFIALILSSVLEMFKKKGKILRAIDHVAIWNLQIYWIVIQLIFPSMLIITGVIFIILLPFSAVNLFLKGLAKEIALCEQSILFISLSIGAIISAHYTKYLFPLITRLLTANGHRYEKYFTILVEYVYNTANLQFVVYFFIYGVSFSVNDLSISDRWTAYLGKRYRYYGIGIVFSFCGLLEYESKARSYQAEILRFI